MLKAQKLSFRRTIRLLALSLMAVVVLIFYYPQVTDDADIWWHLKYGQTVWQTKIWNIDHTAYSWTPADGAWVYVTWLGSLLLYGIHRLGGFFGLGLAQWLIFTGVVAIYNWILRSARLPWTALNIVMLLFAGMAVNPIAVYIKPELFSILFFAAAVAVFFAVKLTGRSSLFWIYPPLFLAWVNIHGGFVYGLAFLGLAWGGEFISYVLNHFGQYSRSRHGNFKLGPASVQPSQPEALLRQSRPRPATVFVCRHGRPNSMLFWFTIVLGLSIGMTFINPYGWRYWPGIFENILAGSGHAHVISAYLPLFPFLIPPPFVFRNMNASWGLLAFAAGLGALLILGYARHRRLDYTVLTANLTFFVAGFFMMRVAIFFVVLWLFSVLYIMTTNRIQVTSLTTKLCVGIAGLAAIILMWETAAFNTYRAYFGRGLNDYVPAQTVEFIRRNSVPKPLFNDYLAGGYLIWALYPDYKVFIDPRYGPYVKTGVWDAYAQLMRSPSPVMLANIQRIYPFQSAVIDTAHCPALADLFLALPDWQLVYFDSVAALFVRKSTANTRCWKGDLSPHRFEHVSNPDILARAFALSCRYNPPDAAVIYDIYKRNVSRLYAYRNANLIRMQKSFPH